MIKNNIFKVKERIAGASFKAGRDPGSITLVCVSKGREAVEIAEAVASGMADIGESKVQEALLKYDDIRNTKYDIRLHMIGHLQTNKVKDAVRMFDLIQSVDSIRLASEIDKQAALINKVQDILIEVNTSGEGQKYGFSPVDASAAVKEIGSFKNIRICGLMTVGPLGGGLEQARSCFCLLRELRDEVRTTDDERLILSMGMSDDFETAIEEGSNMVRLGRLIFEG